MQTGVVTIFGPSKEPGAAQVRSICDAKEIPHITTSFDFHLGLHSFSLDLFPPLRTIGAAIGSLVKYYGWKSFVILYQDVEGIQLINSLLLDSAIHSLEH